MSVDLRTRYLGLELENPIVASSSPLTGRLDSLKRLADNGIAAVVLPSLFEEQIEHEALDPHRLAEYGSNSFAEALDYFPKLSQYNDGPAALLSRIEEAKKILSIPVFASLNGTTGGGWVRYARLMQEAGADAVELNIYHVPADPKASSADVEKRYLDLVSSVRAVLRIPFAVKLHPFFSAPVHMARRLTDAGADGLVLFNRFYQPDIDLETLEVVPDIHLSASEELRLPLRWIAIMRGAISQSLAATTGVHTASDVIKLILAGADAVMMASALLKNGHDHVKEVRRDLEDWLTAHEYESVAQMKGSMSQANCPDPDAFERANYMHALVSFTSPFV